MNLNSGVIPFVHRTADHDTATTRFL